MTRIFYEKHVPDDPLLAPIFAEMSADHPEVAKWLAEVFGGPSYYSDELGGYNRMLGEHLGKHVTEAQRTRWASLIGQAARKAGLPNDAEFQSVFHSHIEWGSRLAVENSQTWFHPPLEMPMPHWDWDTAAGPPGGGPQPQVMLAAPIDLRLETLHQTRHPLLPPRARASSADACPEARWMPSKTACGAIHVPPG